MAGLTDQGYETKRLEDILSDFKKRAEDIFSDLVPAGDTVDTGDNTALGRLIAVQSPAVADLWEASQQIYDAFNPATATGISLDNMVAFSGISRYGSKSTIAQCVFEGSFGGYVGTLAKAKSLSTQRTYSPTAPVYFTMSGAAGIGISVLAVQNSTEYSVRYTNDGGVNYTRFAITSDSTATATEILASLMSYINTTAGSVVTAYMKNGYLYIERVDPFQAVTFEISSNLAVNKVLKMGVVTCDDKGPVEEPARAISAISVPQSGWDSIYNPLPADTGRFEETDEQLRERFRNVKFVQASNILESIVSELRAIDGVKDVVVYENDTGTTNDKGVPGHSFMPIVLGGLSTAIANVIWQNKPIGIQSFGDTTVQILDSQAIEHNVSFKRPEPVRLYINMSLVKNSDFPGDGQAKIGQALLDYLAANYSIGDSIVYSRLYTPINSIPGHQVNSLTLGTSPNPSGMANIPIDFDQIYSLALTDINITVS